MGWGWFSGPLEVLESLRELLAPVEGWGWAPGLLGPLGTKGADCFPGIVPARDPARMQPRCRLRPGLVPARGPRVLLSKASVKQNCCYAQIEIVVKFFRFFETC